MSHSRINQDIDAASLKTATASTYLEGGASWKPNGNICPELPAMVIISNQEDNQRKLIPMRWGLKRNENAKTVLFNARCETLMERPTFKELIEKGQKCVVPVKGYC